MIGLCILDWVPLDLAINIFFLRIWLNTFVITSDIVNLAEEIFKAASVDQAKATRLSDLIRWFKRALVT